MYALLILDDPAYGTPWFGVIGGPLLKARCPPATIRLRARLDSGRAGTGGPRGRLLRLG